MPDLEKDYEQKNLKIIARNAKKIKALYEGSIIEISLVGSTITLKDGTFLLSKYPQLREVINQELQKLHLGIYSTIVNSIKESWDLSNEKNDLLVDKRLAGKKPTANGERILYDPNKGALDEFIKRKEKGLNLSTRIWKSLEPFPEMLEKGLAIGISEGKSAASMARELKIYLNEPDRLYRRVREIRGDKNSKLVLSKSASEYHPGRGNYRSSYRNSLRLTINETNLSYRLADAQRWKSLPFVKAIEVKLSNSHPFEDECNQLKGVYPPDFKFVGWHVHCLCRASAVQISDEEYDKYEDAILSGQPLPTTSKVDAIPDMAKEWLSNNKDKINGWKNTPYFSKYNPDYIGKLLKQ